jgi:hypothetical protein
MHEKFTFVGGELSKGNSIGFNYRLLLEFGNGHKEAAIKALLARLRIPVTPDPEISWSTSVWRLIIKKGT